MNQKMIEKSKIEKSIAYARRTLEIEGRNLTPEAEDLIRRRLSGEITQQEFLQMVKNLATNR